MDVKRIRAHEAKNDMGCGMEHWPKIGLHQTFTT